jgi:hypothetical protein
MKTNRVIPIYKTKQANQSKWAPLKKDWNENQKYMGPTHAKDSNEYNMKWVKSVPPQLPSLMGVGGGGQKANFNFWGIFFFLLYPKMQIHHLWNKFSSCAQKSTKIEWG